MGRGLIVWSRLIANFLASYDERKSRSSTWGQSGKFFKQCYMTDLLHELIQADSRIDADVREGGWVEFDTERDGEVLSAGVQHENLDRSMLYVLRSQAQTVRLYLNAKYNLYTS